MPQNTPAPARICGHCDGFPVVAITTCTRHRDGTRATINATCPACKGTGTVPARRTLATAGR
jgi:DnaJ-class molecular chaperone